MEKEANAKVKEDTKPKIGKEYIAENLSYVN